MPLIKYVNRSPNAATRVLIGIANAIIEEYAADGYALTLRQLYYQFVARDLLPNEQRQYKRLGGIVNDGRLAGLIDWDAIEDRTRNIRGLAHWPDADAILTDAAASFRFDKWQDQPHRVEVWIEKEALAGVFERICRELDVSYFSCRGYVSQSEMWRAAQRLRRYEKAGQKTLILHFGDHDPSGMDMTRDIADRLYTFGSEATVDRLALTMDQIGHYKPPPNPAKLTDSRASGYVSRYGYDSWELDALDPKVLSDLVRGGVEAVRDDDLWKARLGEERRIKNGLHDLAAHFEDAVEAVTP
ncbi:hypothetical protein LCGC14_1035080 [marine sediment metagenome]|uniref:DUF2399 domain-containing protein n=1 Tax=marine sediment metagenome TaxID=412755 RepID=A0A0F9QBM6_9ZZZZ